MDQEKIKLLHSRYNPQTEADRYINSLSLNETIKFFILIEPGLGYMIKPLQKRFPDAKIISLHVESGKPVQEFLEREIPDTPAEDIKMLEWRPALAVYGKAYLALIEETVNFIKRIDANARTTKAFGSRWFKNFLKNVGIIRNVICPASFSMPLVVTGAGPGLESAIPLIRELSTSPQGEVSRAESRRSKLFVLAASSSVMCLETQKLRPDMVISTDGGNWAALHLQDCFRVKNFSNSAAPFPIATSMTAALPSQYEAWPILPISDGSLWQTLVLNKLGIPFISLVQRGTVSASALDLAFALTSGSIFIAGMDLANSDMRSHARPYSFDRLLEEKAQRLNPVYSQAFKRSSLLKTGGSYDIYASWFKEQLASYPKRLFTLGKNNPVFNYIEAPLKTTQGRENPNMEKPEPANFKIVTLKKAVASHEAVSLLEQALLEPSASSPQAKLYKELKGLLLPGKPDVTKNELIETIHTLAGRERS